MDKRVEELSSQIHRGNLSPHPGLLLGRSYSWSSSSVVPIIHCASMVSQKPTRCERMIEPGKFDEESALDAVGPLKG